MKARFATLFLPALLAGLAVTAAELPLLESLAKELGELRALPVGAPTNAKCPAATGSLKGLTGEELRGALGDPDFVDKKAVAWTYFFSSPTPEGQLGGGFPELTFFLGPDNQVIRVSCHYSR